MAKAKFDIKSEAQRGLHASVGAADLALEAIKDYVTEAQKRFEAAQKDAQKRFAEVQKSVSEFEFEPTSLRDQATARVEELTKEAKARRIAVEKRVSELQTEAQKVVSGNVENATDTYEELAKRGETVIRRFRNKPETKATVSNAKTTAAKAKTTRTQAKKSPAKSSAKATGTAAKKTAKSAAKTVSS